MKKDVCYKKKLGEIRGTGHFLCKGINATKQRNAEREKSVGKKFFKIRDEK